jgi:hypothetical protein
MKFTKIIAITLIAASLITFSSCAKNVCDACRVAEPNHTITHEKEKVNLCNYCYQRLIQTETDADVSIIKETAFESLTDEQKNYIVIYVIETIDGDEATNVDGLSREEISENVYNKAATKYQKTADQIKSLVDAHKAAKSSAAK